MIELDLDKVKFINTNGEISVNVKIDFPNTSKKQPCLVISKRGLFSLLDCGIWLFFKKIRLKVR